MHGLLVWVVGFALFMYLIAPIIIRFKQKIAAQPRLEPMDLSKLTPEAAQFLAQTEDALAREGFTMVGHFSMPGLTANVLPVLTLYMNRPAGDKAMATAIYSIGEAGVKLSARYVEFSTRYADGRAVDTNNNGTLGAFKPNPIMPTFRLPGVSDLHRLYAIHRQLLQRAEGPSSVMRPEKVIPPPGEEVAWLCQAMIDGYNKQVEFGWLFLDPAIGAYRPTWAGAYLMTWSELWPIKPLRKAKVRQQEQALLQSLSPDA